MKRITLLILLFSFLNGFSQDFSEKEIIKLNRLNIKTESINLNDLNIQKDLNKILNLEKKRKTNITFGIILTTLSLATITTGIIDVSEKNDFKKVLGTIGIVAGIIYGGISIPLWNASKKRKNERDELLKKFE